jgi:glycine/D-amino acid oxidase-like deaminating enzyme
LSDAFDLLVVGGGVNGVAIARDAVGRGLKALLVDKGDLAGATSSASSKLIHGGLRYLEHGEFRLVREGLTEREVLLRMAPHLVHPLRFILPHGAGSRPRWMVRAGLFLYDRLGGVGSLPASRALHLGQDPAGQPLLDSVRHGFSYADCGTDDARLTIVTARDAALRGAEIAPCTALIAARRDRDLWRAELRTGDGASREVAARVLVNAAGPWVLDVLRIAGLTTRARLRLVKGSHIVVPPPLRRRRRLPAAERRPPRGLRDPVRARLFADRHHRAAVRRRPRRGAHHRRRDCLSLPRRRALVPRTADAGRHCLELCRRAAPPRGSRPERGGGNPRLCLRPRYGGPAGVVGVRRQTDDAPPPRGARANAARIPLAGDQATVDRRVDPARGRRFADGRDRRAHRGFGAALPAD